MWDYGIKRKNDYISTFKTINNELGDNAISEFGDYKKDKQFDKDLENIIKDTCDVKLKLESEKQKLNHVSEISRKLQVHSEAANVQISYEKSEIPLKDMMYLMEENIFEGSTEEQGPVMKKTLNLKNNNK